MGALLKDIGFGVRMLARTPGVSFVAIATIALGVGLTTHTFSVVYGSVLKGLPFDGADRLMALTESRLADGITHSSLSIHDYLDWRAQQTSFDELAAFYQGTVNLADAAAAARPERFLGAFVTSNLLSQVGVQPILGRAFRTGEDQPGAPPTVIIGHDVWQNRYAGDRDILGRTVRANGVTHTIIGVMPPRFRFPFDNTVWMPLGIDALELERGTGRDVIAVGRLRSGVTIDEARREMAAITQRLASEYPETNRGVSAGVNPFTEHYMPPQIIAVQWVMLAAVFGVLLIACANVANLLVARASVRSKEVAIRSALGAGRLHIIRQMMAESLVIALVGGAIGLGLSQIGLDVFNAAIVDIQKPFWIDIGMHGPVVVFGIATTLAASVMAGTVPAIRASGIDIHEILKDETRGSSSLRMSRFSTGLVMGEVALSCALLIAAGLMVKSITRLNNLDMGFETDGIVTARIGLFESDYPDAGSRLRFHDRLLTRLDAIPGVRTAALTSNLPATGAGLFWFGVEGEAYPTDRDYPVTNRSVISPRFFEAFGVRFLEGRDFAERDRDDSPPVAIVNQSFVRRFFADGTALGRRIRLGRSSTTAPWLTVIGVVPDLHVGGGVGGIGSDDVRPEHMYVPLAQNPLTFASLVARVAADPLAIAPEVRGIVTDLDPNLPIYDVDSMEGVVETSTWAFGLFGSLFAIFGGMALFMSAVGLYAVMAFSVHRRTQEMGIRMALGAQDGQIVRLILKRAFVQVGAGLSIGLVLGAFLARPLHVMLFDVQTGDPSVYIAIVVTIAFTGLIAAVGPARRATRIDLVDALRPE